MPIFTPPPRHAIITIFFRHWFRHYFAFIIPRHCFIFFFLSLHHFAIFLWLFFIIDIIRYAYMYFIAFSILDCFIALLDAAINILHYFWLLISFHWLIYHYYFIYHAISLSFHFWLIFHLIIIFMNIFFFFSLRWLPFAISFSFDFQHL